MILASKDEVMELIVSMYVDEPCRICGKSITREDIHNGAVFAGYSKDNTSRLAHKLCWDNAKEIFS